jgi:hypothetical protein
MYRRLRHMYVGSLVSKSCTLVYTAQGLNAIQESIYPPPAGIFLKEKGNCFWPLEQHATKFLHNSPHHS